MGRVRDTIGLIRQYEKYGNEKYDISANNINDIRENSENSLESIVNGYKFGYMQGMKAAKAEMRVQ